MSNLNRIEVNQKNGEAQASIWRNWHGEESKPRRM